MPKRTTTEKENDMGDIEELKAAQQKSCQAQAAGRLNPNYRPSLREQLLKSASGLSDQAIRTNRAIEILHNHPEFEEMLELLDLLKNDRIYR